MQYFGIAEPLRHAAAISPKLKYRTTSPEYIAYGRC